MDVHLVLARPVTIMRIYKNTRQRDGSLLAVWKFLLKFCPEISHHALLRYILALTVCCSVFIHLPSLETHDKIVIEIVLCVALSATERFLELGDDILEASYSRLSAFCVF